MPKSTTENRLVTQLDQLDMLMQGRATLISTLDCDDELSLRSHMQVYLKDSNLKNKLARTLHHLSRSQESY